MKTEKIRRKILELLNKKQLTGKELIDEVSNGIIFKKDRDIVEKIFAEELKDRRIWFSKGIKYKRRPSESDFLKMALRKTLHTTKVGKSKLFEYDNWYHGLITKQQIIPILISILAVTIPFLSLNAQIISITPNKPEISILIPQSQLKLPAQDLAEFVSHGEKVKLEIKNSGGLDTQTLTIMLINSDILEQTSGGSISNVAKGTTEEIELFLKQKTCIYEENCNSTLLPEGPIILTFQINCQNCELNERVQQKPFEFCIWHKSENECEG